MFIVNMKNTTPNRSYRMSIVVTTILTLYPYLQICEYTEFPFFSISKKGATFPLVRRDLYRKVIQGGLYYIGESLPAEF